MLRQIYHQRQAERPLRRPETSISHLIGACGKFVFNDNTPPRDGQHSHARAHINAIGVFEAPEHVSMHQNEHSIRGYLRYSTFNSTSQHQRSETPCKRLWSEMRCSVEYDVPQCLRPFVFIISMRTSTSAHSRRTESQPLDGRQD